MSLFNVIAPCVVDGLHYVNPTKQPIEVDGDQAAELVAAGSLEPYPPARAVAQQAVEAEPVEVGSNEDVEPTVESQPHRRSRRPRSED